MRYRVIGGEQLSEDIFTAQFLINDDEEFCMNVLDVIKRVRKYDDILIERNRLREKLRRLKEAMEE